MRRRTTRHITASEKLSESLNRFGKSIVPGIERNFNNGLFVNWFVDCGEKLIIFTQKGIKNALILAKEPREKACACLRLVNSLAALDQQQVYRFGLWGAEFFPQNSDGLSKTTTKRHLE